MGLFSRNVLAKLRKKMEQLRDIKEIIFLHSNIF